VTSTPFAIVEERSKQMSAKRKESSKYSALSIGKTSVLLHGEGGAMQAQPSHRQYFDRAVER
jgi:hypothetical protein